MYIKICAWKHSYWHYIRFKLTCFFGNNFIYQDKTFGWISSDKATSLFLNAGKTTLGHGNTDINIQGQGVAALHCYIENQAGTITLFPCGNPCSMDGLAVTKPVRLSQGTYMLNGLGKIQKKCLFDVSSSFCLQLHMAKSHNPFTSWDSLSDWKRLFKKRWMLIYDCKHNDFNPSGK